MSDRFRDHFGRRSGLGGLGKSETEEESGEDKEVGKHGDYFLSVIDGQLLGIGLCEWGLPDTGEGSPKTWVPMV